MDDIRDIQKAEQINRFLDPEAVKIRPFGGNISGERAYRRAERLLTALYLLTNHVPSSEPLRREVRANSIGLTSDMLKLKDSVRVPHSEAYKQLSGRIRQLITLVRALAVSGYVSAQNAQATVDALDELGTFLANAQRSTLSDAVSVNREELTSIGHEYFKDIKDTRSQVKTARRIHPRPEGDRPRSDAILQTLRNKGELGIKDISSNLPEYSEKMIQRELAVLIEGKKVKKTGFKRWSKYAIANP